MSTDSNLILTESVKYCQISAVISGLLHVSVGILQDRVYACKITSVDELKQRISDEWKKIDQQLIDSAVKQWHKRLAACVSAPGGHLEHMLQSRTPKLINSLYSSSL